MPRALDLETVVVATKNQISGRLQEELVILSFADDTYYGLNRIATQVWKCLENPTAIRDVLRLLLDRYDVEEERCRRDLIELLGVLLDRGLLEVCEKRPAS